MPLVRWLEVWVPGSSPGMRVFGGVRAFCGGGVEALSCWGYWQ